MIRVYAIVRIPTRVLGAPQPCLATRVHIIHTRQASATPHSTRLRGSRPPSTE